MLQLNLDGGFSILALLSAAGRLYFRLGTFDQSPYLLPMKAKSHYNSRCLLVSSAALCPSVDEKKGLCNDKKKETQVICIKAKQMIIRLVNMCLISHVCRRTCGPPPTSAASYFPLVARQRRRRRLPRSTCSLSALLHFLKANQGGLEICVT